MALRLDTRLLPGQSYSSLYSLTGLSGLPTSPPGAGRIIAPPPPRRPGLPSAGHLDPLAGILAPVLSGPAWRLRDLRDRPITFGHNLIKSIPGAPPAAFRREPGSSKNLASRLKFVLDLPGSWSASAHPSFDPRASCDVLHADSPRRLHLTPPSVICLWFRLIYCLGEHSRMDPQLRVKSCRCLMSPSEHFAHHLEVRQCSQPQQPFGRHRTKHDAQSGATTPTRVSSGLFGSVPPPAARTHIFWRRRPIASA